MRRLIFSDLDGTFLDHHTYDEGPAIPILLEVLRLGVPCIWNTSKTFPEVLEFRQRLAVKLRAAGADSSLANQTLKTPFIVENGAAVFLPEESRLSDPRLPHQSGFQVKSFAPPRTQVLKILEGFRNTYRYRSFADMTREELIDCTGLTAAQAALAAERGFTEPVLWQDAPEALTRFNTELVQQGLRSVAGGRFLHISGHHDKGEALRWLTLLFEANYPEQRFQTIALGDGRNDIPMLEQADIAVTIPSASGTRLNLQTSRHIIRPEHPGPQGWADAMRQILEIPYE